MMARQFVNASNSVFHIILSETNIFYEFLVHSFMNPNNPRILFHIIFLFLFRVMKKYFPGNQICTELLLAYYVTNGLSMKNIFCTYIRS